MGRFTVSVVEKFLSTHRTFVETGTLYGAGISRVLPYFDHIFSIEVDEKLHAKAVLKFHAEKKVHCLLGDSKVVLKTLIPELPTSHGVIFFLDAHWSGDRTVDWAHSLWKGYVESGYAGEEPSAENQVPLLGELKAIVASYPGPAVICIDDMDKFDPYTGRGMKNFKFQGEDWSHLTVDLLKRAVLPRLKAWTTIGVFEQVLIELHPLKTKVNTGSTS